MVTEIGGGLKLMELVNKPFSSAAYWLKAKSPQNIRKIPQPQTDAGHLNPLNNANLFSVATP